MAALFLSACIILSYCSSTINSFSTASSLTLSSSSMEKRCRRRIQHSPPAFLLSSPLLLHPFVSKRNLIKLSMSSSESKGEEDEEDPKEEGKENETKNENEQSDSAINLSDLSWRIEKLRLEEANTRSFLKSKPRKLPYNECRKWVQAWGKRWTSKADWENWIAMGEKRNAYIPAEPDVYYGQRGCWISWEHFLGTEEEKESYGVEGDGTEDLIVNKVGKDVKNEQNSTSSIASSADDDDDAFQ